MHVTNFYKQNRQKKVFRMVNFTNLKTSGSYIVKSKPQGVCLQLSQTPGGDYVIWPIHFYNFGYNLFEMCCTNGSKINVISIVYRVK
jgi:hypothetical protein